MNAQVCGVKAQRPKVNFYGEICALAAESSAQKNGGR